MNTTSKLSRAIELIDYTIIVSVYGSTNLAAFGMGSGKSEGGQTNFKRR